MAVGEPDVADKSPDWRAYALLATVVYLTVKVILLACAAVGAQFVMDEYDQAGAAGNLGEFYKSIIPVKNVLYAVFYSFSHYLSDSSVELMQYARLQTLVVALLSLGMVYAIGRKLGYSIFEALFCVCIMLAFSTYMERGFRVRAEPLAVLFGLLSFYALLAWDQINRKSVFLAGLLLGLAFLTTQKTIYMSIAFGLGMFVVVRGASGLKSALMSSLLMATGFLISVFFYSLFFAGKGFLDVISAMILGPVDLQMNATSYYNNLGSFVWQTINRNTLAYGLCFSGWVAAVISWDKLDHKIRCLLVSATLLAGLVFTHNQPWPYVFVIIIPFISLLSGLLLQVMRGVLGSTHMLFCLLIVSLFITLPKNIQALEQTNILQFEVMQRAESMLNSSEYYEDGIGMLPKRLRAGGNKYWWDQIAISRAYDNASKGDFGLIADTMRAQPKLWIDSYRLERMRGLFDGVLDRGYVKIHSNIYLSGVRLEDGEETAFTNYWDGVYELYDKSGKQIDEPLEINGEMVSPPFSLKPETYKIKGVGGRYLLPSGIGRVHGIGSNSMPLFMSTYTY